MLENSKMIKKNPPLPSRPEPPAVEKVVKDIQDAPVDDIVFTLLTDQPKGQEFTVIYYRSRCYQRLATTT